MTTDERDYLTQLLTRAAFDAALDRFAGQATSDQPASLIIADIDHFKKVNDTHGHQVGDAVLAEVARRLRGVVDGKGTAYRYGGEEFVVVLANHSIDEALAVAERARRGVEANPAGGVAVTSSYGVATIPFHASGAAAWLRKADEALYQAKHLGRNLVRLAGEPPPEPGQARPPTRKQAVAGTLSDEEQEEMRLNILRRGEALCPRDKILLEVLDVTESGSMGKSFNVQCPGCGFQAYLPGPRRG